MIKCDYFGKLLKQGLFTLLISCFILLGGSFVSATFQTENYSYYSDVNITSYYGSYGYSMNKYGTLFTNSVKNFFWNPTMSNGRILLISFGWLDGNLYYYQRGKFGDNPYYSLQGYINNWCVSPVSSRFDNNGFLHSSCVYNTSIEDVLSLSSDYIGYIFTIDGSVSPDYIVNNENYFQFCFTDNVNDYCFACGGQYCPSGLTGSLNYDLSSFSKVSDVNWSSSPLTSYTGELQGSLEVGGNVDITGDYLYSTCTYGELIDYFDSQGWNKYYCYGGLDNFSLYDSSINYNPIPGSGKTLNEIWINAQGTWSTPLEWYNFRNGLYGDSKFDSMWESYPAVYHTWFDLYKQYGGGWQNFDDVIEYCNIVLNYNSLSGVVYNGLKFRGVCANLINDRNNNYNQDVIGTNWNGVGNFSGKVQSNAVEFIQDFFNKAKSVVPTNFPNSGFGFLPTYILIFLCAIILFRFISH